MTCRAQAPMLEQGSRATAQIWSFHDERVRPTIATSQRHHCASAGVPPWCALYERLLAAWQVHDQA
jgi:hypothetical protein